MRVISSYAAAFQTQIFFELRLIIRQSHLLLTNYSKLLSLY